MEQLFTIWLRNGAPDMYDPPLNLTLARHVDFVGKSQVEVQDVIDFLAGPGCESQFIHTYCEQH